MGSESVSETLGNFNTLIWLSDREHLIEDNVSSPHPSRTVRAPNPQSPEQLLPGVKRQESDVNMSLSFNIMVNK